MIKVFDEAIGKFALACSKQTDEDHETLDKARRSGHIKVAAQEIAKQGPASLRPRPKRRRVAAR